MEIVEDSLYDSVVLKRSSILKFQWKERRLHMTPKCLVTLNEIKNTRKRIGLSKIKKIVFHNETYEGYLFRIELKNGINMYFRCITPQEYLQWQSVVLGYKKKIDEEKRAAGEGTRYLLLPPVNGAMASPESNEKNSKRAQQHQQDTIDQEEQEEENIRLSLLQDVNMRKGKHGHMMRFLSDVFALNSPVASTTAPLTFSQVLSSAPNDHPLNMDTPTNLTSLSPQITTRHTKKKRPPTLDIVAANGARSLLPSSSNREITTPTTALLVRKDACFSRSSGTSSSSPSPPRKS